MTESRLPLPRYVDRTSTGDVLTTTTGGEERFMIDHTHGGLYPDVDPATGDEQPIEGFDEDGGGAALSEAERRIIFAARHEPFDYAPFERTGREQQRKED